MLRGAAASAAVMILALLSGCGPEENVTSPTPAATVTTVTGSVNPATCPEVRYVIFEYKGTERLLRGAGNGEVVKSDRAYVDTTTDPDTVVVEVEFVDPPFGWWILTQQGWLQLFSMEGTSAADRIGVDEKVTYLVIADDPTVLPGWDDSCMLGNVRFGDLN